MSLETQTDEQLAALRVCPDFKLTSSGPYKKNVWTEFADNFVLTQPDQHLGLSMDNYQNWLDWAYDNLAESDIDDPILGYARDLRAFADGRFDIPWLMSFEEKGFKVDGIVGTKSGLIFNSLTPDNLRLERELVPNRFGELVVLERYYDADGRLDDIGMVYRDDKGQLILRFDDPNMWGYQFSQLSSRYPILRSNVHIEDLAVSLEPLAKAALAGSYSTSVYTGETIKGQ